MISEVQTLFQHVVGNIKDANYERDVTEYHRGSSRGQWVQKIKVEVLGILNLDLLSEL